MNSGTLNCITVDWEDWYQVPLAGIPKEKWQECRPNLVESTGIILDFFSRKKVKATFFISGYAADRHPDLVQDIHRHGHEIASHGYWHILAYKQTNEEFTEDLRRARESVYKAIGVYPKGYRAPAWSISLDPGRYLPLIKAAGFKWDSSLFPIRGFKDFFRPNLGYSSAVSPAHLPEYPPTVCRRFGINWPLTGGFFLRLFPWSVYKSFFDYQMKKQQHVHFYFHPWEILKDYPEQNINFLFKFVQYYKCGRFLGTLENLVDRYRFGSVSEVYLPSKNSATPDQIPLPRDSHLGPV